MSSTVDRVPAWEDASYQQLEDVSFDGTQLQVRFANEDVVMLPPDRLLPTSVSSDADWSRARAAGPELLVPVDGDDCAVSGFDIRALTDRLFARHLAQLADEQARLVGQRIRTLRESRGLGSAELARRAGIAAQSLSRIELGRHDVVYTTLQRILAAMNYSLTDLAATPAPVIDLRAIVRRLREAGLPATLIERLAMGTRPGPIADRLQRIFGWTAADLISDEPLPLRAAPGLSAQFKADIRQRPAEGAYALYAHYVAMLVSQALRERGEIALPSSAQAIRTAVLDREGGVSFEGLLRFAWDSGIAVVPLSDPGQFHGACWLVNGRPLIVLKQITNSDARCAFDLAHELGHVVLLLGGDTTSVVEREEIARSTADSREQEATIFAGEVILGEPEALAQRAAQRAQFQGPLLKRATVEVARESGVSVGALANYLAFRLSEDIPWWWAVAQNLQEPTDEAPFALARRELLDRLDLDRLAEDDRALLENALEGDEED